jgi:hypothetical protein
LFYDPASGEVPYSDSYNSSANFYFASSTSEALRQLRKENSQLKAQLSQERSSVKQLTVANSQLLDELKSLYEDNHPLQQQVESLTGNGRGKETQFYYKQKAVYTLHHESEEEKWSVEQRKQESIEQLQRHEEETRETFSGSNLAVNVPDGCITSDKDLGSEGALVYLVELIVSIISLWSLLAYMSCGFVLMQSVVWKCLLLHVQ